MLKKLLKYDLLNVYKILIVFYLLSICFSIFTRIFFCIENSLVFNVIGKICSGTLIALIINCLINNLCRCWIRFSKNIYGDESYLTHTLPVSKTKIYLSKFLSSLITMFTSILVILVSAFIAYYSKENLELLKSALLIAADAYDSTVIKLLLVGFIVFLLEMLLLLQAGFSGIILGHRKNSHKTAFSFLFGYISYLVCQLFVLVVLFLFALGNSDIMNLFKTTVVPSTEIIKKVMVISIIIYTLGIAIIYFINLKLFKKGVNVD